MEARWSRGGSALPPIRVAPRECAPAEARQAGPFAVEVPAEITAACPSVGRRLDEFIRQVEKETPSSVSGGDLGPLLRSARMLFAAIALLAFWLAFRGAVQIRSAAVPWVLLGAFGFLAALVVRATLPFTLGNWYSEVLPAAGPPTWIRFGPGSFAFQSLLRSAGFWDTRALFLSQIALGALALPLLLGVLRELRVDLPAAAATLVLFVIAPFHARLSATTSEHVLASTLCLALLYSWLRTARTAEWPWLLLTILLFPAVCATRIDMTVQASLVLVWPLLRDRVERERGLSGRRLWRRAAIVGFAAAAAALLLYRFVALPSNHPMPELAGQLLALHYSIRQFWMLSTNPPGWISLSSVLLAVPGVLWMAVRRPFLLIRVAGTVLVPFVALGRTFLHDELVGARYFLFTIPIFLIASGMGFEALMAPLPRRARRFAAAVSLPALYAWSLLAAQPAYDTRYAFQDEYSFARSALAELSAGCVVYEVPIRDDALPRDVDCCLDVQRSPLALDFPELQFLNLPDDPVRVFTGTGCVAYYETIACQIAARPGQPSAELAEKAAAYFGPRCAAVRRIGHLEPVAESTTSPLATENLFGGKSPHVGVYRWRP